MVEIESALTAISRMKSYLSRGRNYNIPLAYYDENIEELDDIRQVINMSIMNEAVSDNASRLLKSLRADIDIANDKMKSKADATMRSNKTYMADSFSTIRNGHVCIPVKKEYKHKIEGIVIDKSASGNTIFMEPISSARYYEELQQLRIDGQNISENLSTFSAHITNVLDILGNVNNESLVIMDELGSGTDPLEGMGIAISILEELKDSGAFFIVTTHYPEIKMYADEVDCIVNARMTFDRENLRPLYYMEIGEAGKSCAFYIASRLGMPTRMIKRAAKEVYGDNYDISKAGIVKKEIEDEYLVKRNTSRIVKKKKPNIKKKIELHRGDSVMVYPDKKIGIVCKEANDKGVLQVQLPGKKIWINHKRVKLHVPASELYPEDYDFSIIFDSVENRKARHQMERKYIEETMIEDE